MIRLSGRPGRNFAISVFAPCVGIHAALAVATGATFSHQMVTEITCCVAMAGALTPMSRPKPLQKRSPRFRQICARQNKCCKTYRFCNGGASPKQSRPGLPVAKNMKDGIPETALEADGLRAYIPTDKLVELAKIRDEEIKESENQSRDRGDDYVRLAAAKDKAKKLRIEIKRLDKKINDSWSKPLFARLEARLAATWREASQARAASLDRGETSRHETGKQCSERQKASQASVVYTP